MDQLSFRCDECGNVKEHLYPAWAVNRQIDFCNCHNEEE